MDTDGEWLASYLRLEYGEDANDPDSIKAKDLIYEGEYIVNGIPTKYWRYPTSDGPSWVVIEEGETRCASFAFELPQE